MSGWRPTHNRVVAIFIWRSFLPAPDWTVLLSNGQVWLAWGRELADRCELKCALAKLGKPVPASEVEL